jgi:hypothetical protein
MTASPVISAACATLLLAVMATGQTPTKPNAQRTLTFAATQSPIGRQEIVNAIRLLTQSSPTFDEARGEIRVSGQASQVELAAWLFAHLDQPVDRGSHDVVEHRVQGTPDEVARVFYPQNFRTPQELQEFINAVRALTEITRIQSTCTWSMKSPPLPCNNPPRVALRAEVRRADLAEWLLRWLDRPADNLPTEPAKWHFDEPLPPQYQTPQYQAPEVRVSYLNVRTPQELQETVNALRLVTEMTRMMPFNPLRAIVWRGNAEQDAAGEWILKALDAPDAPATSEYSMKGPEGLVKLIHFPRGTPPATIQAFLNAVRTSTGLQRIIPLNTRSAVLLRGNAGQVAQAEELLRENGQ